MDDRGILELLRTVRAPSHPGVPRQEEGVALALEAHLRRSGIRSDLVEVREGRPNLLASIEGRGPGPHLLFCGHLDTVPPNAGAAADLSTAVQYANDYCTYGDSVPYVKSVAWENPDVFPLRM